MQLNDDDDEMAASQRACFREVVEEVLAKLQVAAMRQWLRGAAAIGGGAIARVPSSRRSRERERARGRGETRGEGRGVRGVSYPHGRRDRGERFGRDELAIVHGVGRWNRRRRRPGAFSTEPPGNFISILFRSFSYFIFCFLIKHAV